MARVFHCAGLAYMDFKAIPGLRYIPTFLSVKRERLLCQFIDSIDPTEWVADFRRRKICFGYRYDYASRSIACQLGPLPPILRDLSEDLCTEGLMTYAADQVIVNEHLPGQGISAHVDA